MCIRDRLDLTSTDKVFLPPRLTTAQRDSITVIPAGAMIYNLDENCMQYWDTARWKGDCTPAPLPGTIATLDCAGAVNNGTLASGTAAAGVSSIISYTGGNGNAHGGQIVASTGVTGLSATLAAGSFATGNGTVTYTITGTPSAAGTASFAITIGGQNCVLTRTVGNGGATVVLPGNPQAWMRHNLGADTSLDPDVPVNGIHGNYYQWGRAAIVASANSITGPIVGWGNVLAPDNSWRDAVKTGADPCPSGFRVPSSEQWNSMVNNNTTSNIGTFTSSPTNFESAKVFGSGANKLTLPASGRRSHTDGALLSRGSNGYYWSTTYGTISWAVALSFISTNVEVSLNTFRSHGASIRCIEE